MAKRAPILAENYNPVGARLRSVVAPVPPTVFERVPLRTEPVTAETILKSDDSTVLELPTKIRAEEEGREENPSLQLVGKEIKESYLRFRCTDTERKKWHDITREITGEHNQLSHLMRACLMLLENSYEQLQKVSPDIQRMKRPASQDSMGLALYEQRLSQYLFDAIRSAGRPRG